jgi:RNA polymerase sigma-70 factor, ECF subfamily
LHYFDKTIYAKTMEGTAELLRANPVSLQDQVGAAYEEFREDVYRYLVLLGLPPAQAQDVTQESFLRMYVAQRAGTRIRSSRAWIFTVAHNLALNWKQSEPGTTSYDPVSSPEIAADEPDPERRIINQQRALRLQGALGTLSEQQRQCLLLRAEGFRYREIAEIIGVGTSTVGEFLRRAIHRLRKAVYEQQ